VLVCDDTESIRRLIRVNLELEGFEVVEALEGGAALDILVERAGTGTLPDVLVLDSQMSPRDGWWAIARIRSDPTLADLPVVMVTASLQHHQRSNAGAVLDAFVGKPFDPERLVELVVGFAVHGRAFRPAGGP